ncbi:hypothetical protein QFC24_005139 [Naganishia onofrii]|uniref:Uncharacterized protein n=1 Tax=Naganishia onofrii TaxID=1851511 RepID=A0ACC2XCK2_9TREE|nr:hypothetical protein QFC24_005139 [Naganishia onofrii]
MLATLNTVGSSSNKDSSDPDDEEACLAFGLSILDEFFKESEDRPRATEKESNPPMHKETGDEGTFLNIPQSPITILSKVTDAKHPLDSSRETPDSQGISLISPMSVKSQVSNSPPSPGKTGGWRWRAEERALRQALKDSSAAHAASLPKSAAPSSTMSDAIATTGNSIPQTRSRGKAVRQVGPMIGGVQRMRDGTVCESCKKSKTKCQPWHALVSVDQDLSH